jgi:hypothetical protein
MWGYAAEVKEEHGLPDPINGSLAGENAIIAVGTDAHRKRAALFLPLNILPGHESTYTEAAQALFVKTAPNSRYIDGGLFQGDYLHVLRTDGVNARTFLTATGNYSAPILDLHGASTAGNGAALALNAVHGIQWQDANAVTLGGISYDTNQPTQQTFGLSGVAVQPVPGQSGQEMVLVINGVRYGIALRPLQ